MNHFVQNESILPSIPHMTAEMARVVLSPGNFYLMIGDQVDHLFSGWRLEDCTLMEKANSSTLARFFLITIFQYMETLTDVAAGEALSNRLDWKYALHLPLHPHRLNPASLCSFRVWLLADPVRKEQLGLLLAVVVGKSGIKKPRKLPLGAQVLEQVCLISRLETVYTTMSQAVVAIHELDQDCMPAIFPTHWLEIYRSDLWLSNLPGWESSIERFTTVIGKDIHYLLEAVSMPAAQKFFKLPIIAALRDVWQDQYSHSEWRKPGCLHCQEDHSLSWLGGLGNPLA